MPDTIEIAGVVGGGFMGSGIAESCARSGVHVVVHEPFPEALERSRAQIEQSVDRAVSGGKLDAEQAGELKDRITWTLQPHDLASADVVVEAVSENLELKVDIFNRLGGICRPDAILASNTSSIPIAELAQASTNPERVLGLHFFSPVPVMRLVEVVRALDTSEETIGRAQAFCEQIGKRPIVTKDRSGFVVNMLLVPYLMAAVRMYEEGFAEADAIDEGMRLGCGHPMGPLTLCDFIGLDVLYAVCNSLYEEFKQPEYAPPPLLKRMVASGRLGKKAGRGFYTYG